MPEPSNKASNSPYARLNVGALYIASASSKLSNPISNPTAIAGFSSTIDNICWTLNPGPHLVFIESTPAKITGSTEPAISIW